MWTGGAENGTSNLQLQNKRLLDPRLVLVQLIKMMNHSNGSKWYIKLWWAPTVPCNYSHLHFWHSSSTVWNILILSVKFGWLLQFSDSKSTNLFKVFFLFWCFPFPHLFCMGLMKWEIFKVSGADPALICSLNAFALKDSYAGFILGNSIIQLVEKC